MGQLGGDSRYAKALSDDPAVARLVLGESSENEPEGHDSRGSSWRPAHSDWTMEHELLAQIRDLTGRAHFKDFGMFPRPESAIETLRAEMEEARRRSGYENILSVVEAGKRRWRGMSQEERDAMGQLGQEG